MKSILLTLFHTKRGLDILDEEFEDDLKRKSAIIFGVYTAVLFLFNSNYEEASGFVINLLWLAFLVFISIIIWLLIALLFHKIGKILSGKANYVEVLSVIAYSVVPIILGLIIVGILKNTELFAHDFNNLYSRNFILYISWFFSLKILIQGLAKFNQYGLLRALLNISPFIILQVILKMYGY